MSQKQDILRHLKAYGSITPMAALHVYGCMRLSARIGELKDEGTPIISGKMHLPNGKTVAIYTLDKRKSK